MAKSKQEIIDYLEGHINDFGGVYKSWYVGISEDAKNRLRNGHKVKVDDEGADTWIFSRASSSNVAREIETYFTETKKTDGGPGGGDSDSDMVYAYKKVSHTKP